MTKQAATFVERHRAAIADLWRAELRVAWGSEPGTKIAEFERDLSQGLDILSLLAHRLGIETAHSYEDVILHISRRVQSETFLISDLFQETVDLKQAISGQLAAEGPSAPVAAGKIARACDHELDAFFKDLLRETSNVYEYISESGERGLCTLDGDGRITYANRRLCEILHAEDLFGRSFPGFFGDGEEETVLSAIGAPGGAKSTVRELSPVLPDGSRTRVALEIGPLVHPTRHSVAYAALTEATASVSLDQDILDHFSHGIVRTDDKRKLVYMNPKARGIIGADMTGPVSFDDFITDPESKQRLLREMERRDKGELGEYEIKIQRIDDGRQVPVGVLAIPLRDAQSRAIGAIGFIRSLEVEQSKHRINEYVDSGHDDRQILHGLCRELTSRFDADLVIVSRISTARTHARPLYILEGDKESQWLTRWFEISPAIVRWNDQKEILPIGDLKAFFAQPEWAGLSEEPDIKGLLEGGLRSSMRIPVIQGEKVIATVSLLSRHLNAYGDVHRRLAEQLPVPKAVLMALYQIEMCEMAFRFDLVRDLIEAKSFDEIGSLLTRRLAKHYGWHNVSIFRAEPDHQVLRLRYQAAGEVDGYELADGLKVDMDGSVIGYAAKTRQQAYLRDVGEDSDLGRLYLAGSDRTRSELALPILYHGDVLWVLNIEDSKRNAFSDEELTTLRLLVNQVTALIDQMASRHLFESTRNRTTDMFLMTDDVGRIIDANPAAKDFLGFDEDDGADRVPRRLGDVFVDREEAERLVRLPHFNNRQVPVRAHDGRTVNMLMSMFDMPGEISGKVFVGKSLELQERIAQLETVETLFNEIAMEVKAPLSLMYGWLRRLVRGGSGMGVEEFVSRAMTQLRKMELTYDHMAYSNADEVLMPNTDLFIDVRKLVEDIGSLVRTGDDPIVDAEFAADLGRVRGDPYQLGFVIESIFSYLLRSLPADGRIRLRASRQDRQVNLMVAAPVPTGRAVQVTDETSELSRVVSDLTLGKRMIQRLVANHGGHMEEPRFTDGTLTFELTLPVAGDITDDSGAGRLSAAI